MFLNKGVSIFPVFWSKFPLGLKNKYLVEKKNKLLKTIKILL